MTEQRPPSDVEPVRWEDEDALFGEPADGPDGWPYGAEPPESEEDRLERERRERARHSRNPVIRATAGLPRSVRVTIDWAVTIVGAIAIVLAIEFQRIEHVAQFEGKHDRAREPDDEPEALQDADAHVKR